MTEVVRRHGQVLGLATADASTTVNLGPGAGGLFLTKIEVPDDSGRQDQLADALDAVARIVDETGAETPGLPR